MPDKPKETNGQQPDSSFIQLDDAKQKGAASAASAPRRKALVGVFTAACVALIVVSLGFVHPSTSGAWSIDWIVQAVTGESVVANDARGAGSAAASGKADSKNSKASGDAKDKSKDSGDAKGDSESSNKSSDKNSDGKKSEDQRGKKSGDVSAAQNTETADTSNTSGGTSSGGGQSSGGASASNGGTASSGGQGGTQEPSYVTVTVAVTSSAVGNPVSAGGTYTFNEGATVYDALCALGLSVNAHGSSYGTYVAAIGGLAEKQYGGTSGWMYSVNGSTLMTACSNYVLSNGDNVVWYYVTG
ncbi:DUF4430 domain-containing protein [Collinsella aerofaciens]|uniref:DUF4430 domain-containing protein n=1 Tax=Collinsella aerofaciens TaxID=74426 RepID=A0AAW6AIJ9_9ACTN|nr:DUF4430 domain-containing protein [Collinsella aerofaciens]MDB1834307.1 DUF4430 domain-containing protein [Collinsella aerofaciens]MDB1836373.1 DUF4430 domain-containing protein [Collinsella aerofaciens]MDB1838384.1 DUF4430 domain-containing protein [Collinsella aerofaciens]MDB1840075.1 DUF4430 domain-containing protein [Collinsella aerofaciens]MDB1841806.1 DUF4430 domain-containing protein [Collinsella aerofaciens]